jgi:hypothetical protein
VDCQASSQRRCLAPVPARPGNLAVPTPMTQGIRPLLNGSTGVRNALAATVASRRAVSSAPLHGQLSLGAGDQAADLWKERCPDLVAARMR